MFVLAQTQEAIELAKLAAQVETVQALQMILTIALAVIVILAIMFIRNSGSQNRTNENTVTGVFGITNKLINTLESLDAALRQFGVDFTKSVGNIEKIVETQNAIHNELAKQDKRTTAFMTTLLDTDQLKTIMDRTDVPIPDNREDT